MVKGALKISLVSLAVIFLISCSIPATYSHKDIKAAITKICKDGFDREIRVASVGQTVWVYVPFTNLVDSDGQWNQETLETRRQIFIALGRVFLSSDRLPDFYCLLASNIEGKGLDTYTVGAVADLVQFNLGYISFTQWEERIAFFSFPNPEALGDHHGRHMQEYDIAPEEFAEYLSQESSN